MSSCLRAVLRLRRIFNRPPPQGRETARRFLPLRALQSETHGNRYREVVQRCEGLWLHHPGRRRRGRLRPSHRHPGRGVSYPRRGTEGVVRREPRTEGPAGAERQAGLATHLETFLTGPGRHCRPGPSCQRGSGTPSDVRKNSTTRRSSASCITGSATMCVKPESGRNWWTRPARNSRSESWSECRKKTLSSVVPCTRSSGRSRPGASGSSEFFS